MPVTPTYPGVYVEEIPSGVRTIVGVPTAVTAFLGRAERGPDEGPGLTVFSFDDFERKFGGLSLDYPLTFAVRDFFLNGGAQAVVARLTTQAAGSLAAAAVSPPAVVGPPAFPAYLPNVKAASKGVWGNNLFLVEIKVTDTPSPEVMKRYGLKAGEKLYDVTVAERDFVSTRQPPPVVPAVAGGAAAVGLNVYRVVRSETIRNIVFVKDSESSRRADKVLAAESQLLRVANADLTAPTKLDRVDPTTGKKVGETDLTPPADTAARVFVNGNDGGGRLADADYKFADRLGRVDIFNLMCLPPDRLEGNVNQTVIQQAVDYCTKRRAMLIVDPPSTWNIPSGGDDPARMLNDLSLTGPEARNAAVYFPRVRQVNPLRDGAVETFVPCGIVAGRMSATDIARGVWKAPAGVDVAVGGTTGLEYDLTDDENGLLNPVGINCLRTFPVYGRVIWGSRTLRGADALGDDYKYIPVRRLALFIEESLFRGTKWVVQEPNGEALWALIRANVGAFMQGLFRQGAFAGTTPQQAYFVTCDKTNNPDIEVNQGKVTIRVGFAPLLPAEFVIIQLAQIRNTGG